LSRVLLERVHGWGGRFLEYKEQTGEWEIVPENRARNKCAQALREINSAENRAAKRRKYTHDLTQNQSGRNHNPVTSALSIVYPKGEGKTEANTTPLMAVSSTVVNPLGANGSRRSGTSCSLDHPAAYPGRNGNSVSSPQLAGISKSTLDSFDAVVATWLQLEQQDQKLDRPGYRHESRLSNEPSKVLNTNSYPRLPKSVHLMDRAAQATLKPQC
jgi:hypothetical protein